MNHIPRPSVHGDDDEMKGEIGFTCELRRLDGSVQRMTISLSSFYQVRGDATTRSSGAYSRELVDSLKWRTFPLISHKSIYELTLVCGGEYLEGNYDGRLAWRRAKAFNVK